MAVPGSMDEIERIRAEYARRELAVPKDRYALTNVASLFAHQQRSRALLRLLTDERLIPLEGKRVLDVGCGEGSHLLDLIRWGGRRHELAGIDLIETRIATAVARLGRSGPGPDGGPDLRIGDASQLPWADRSFDIVEQNTVFTSIADGSLKGQIATEMLRVLKPGGVIVWYDFAYDNPQNRHVKGVGRREIAALFPGCNITLRKVTLAPPIARRTVRWSWIGSLVLEKLTLLNTHYLGAIRTDGRR